MRTRTGIRALTGGGCPGWSPVAAARLLVEVVAAVVDDDDRVVLLRRHATRHHPNAVLAGELLTGLAAGFDVRDPHAMVILAFWLSAKTAHVGHLDVELAIRRPEPVDG